MGHARTHPRVASTRKVEIAFPFTRTSRHTFEWCAKHPFRFNRRDRLTSALTTSSPPAVEHLTTACRHGKNQNPPQVHSRLSCCLRRFARYYSHASHPQRKEQLGAGAKSPRLVKTVKCPMVSRETQFSLLATVGSLTSDPPSAASETQE